MTTPSILSDAAAGHKARIDRSGAVRSEKSVAAVPASTASGTVIGMHRFEAGFSLQQLAIKTDDLDTSTNVTLDVGYVFDDGSGDSTAAFLSASAIAQTGSSFVWPVATGLLVGAGFVATKGGYIVIKTGGGSTTTAGNVTTNALFSYDA